MSYCFNPACTSPHNSSFNSVCQACGAVLMLRDRYQASRILGRGGFATTFLVTDQGLPGQPDCVIKQLRPVLTADHIIEMSRELFHREAKILGQIGNHPQLPRLLDFFELAQDFYLVQEYVEGSTLQQEVKKTGPLTETMVVTVIREVLVLLDYLHAQKVIHRDIKPANIIRRAIDQKLVLIDFGAVKEQVSQTVVANTPDEGAFTSFAVGTPGYAPPEQMAMRPVYGSDIYSLGVTCLYLLTGKSPKEMNYDPVTGELCWREQISVSTQFQKVLEKMLMVSVRDRYQSAQETLQALDQPLQDAAYAQSLSATQTRGPSATRPSASGRLPAEGRASLRARAQTIKARSQDSKEVTSQTAGGRGDRSTPVASVPSKLVGKMTPNAVKHAYSRGQKDFSGRDLSQLNLRRFQLSRGIFHEALLHHTDLRSANLNNANLGRANLAGATLRDANLSQAYLSYADLEAADLRGADLSDAYLNNANLRGANLCGANLTGAKVSEAQLMRAQTNWLTIMPNGKRGKRFW